MPKQISQEVKDAVRAEVQENGTTHRKLAERYDISRGSVLNILQGHKKKPLSGSGDIKFRRVAKYYCDGCRAFVKLRPCPACLTNAAKSHGKHSFG